MYFLIILLENMYSKLIVCFAASYFTLKTMASMIVMPLLKSKSEIDGLTDESKSHYHSVKKDRTIKGCISIGVGFLLGIMLFIILKPYMKSNRVSCICTILFATFFSMQIVYELLWQDRFIFEHNNIDTIEFNDDTVNDIKTYASMYKRSRFAMNVIEVSSISMSSLLTLILYYKLNR
tara:strand:+ start:75 stop:608 length:534 start_codon:yes stop_codon:yes gene_type:complete